MRSRRQARGTDGLPRRPGSQPHRPTGAAETVMTDDAFSPLGRPRSDQLCPPSCEIDTPEPETVQAHVPAKPTCPKGDDANRQAERSRRPEAAGSTTGSGSGSARWWARGRRRDRSSARSLRGCSCGRRTDYQLALMPRSVERGAADHDHHQHDRSRSGAEPRSASKPDRGFQRLPTDEQVRQRRSYIRSLGGLVRRSSSMRPTSISTPPARVDGAAWRPRWWRGCAPRWTLAEHEPNLIEGQVGAIAQVEHRSLPFRQTVDGFQSAATSAESAGSAASSPRLATSRRGIGQTATQAMLVYSEVVGRSKSQASRSSTSLPEPSSRQS